MNGPFGYYRYRDDAGRIYRIRVKGSKAVIVGMVAAADSVPRLPLGLKPRVFKAQSVSTGRRIDFVYPVGNNSTWVNASTLVFEGETFAIYYKRGERWSRV